MTEKLYLPHPLHPSCYITDVGPVWPAGPCYSPVLKRVMSSAWVCAWGKFAFILLLMDVLRCYIREDAPPTPLCEPPQARCVLRKAAEPMWTCAFPALGRAAGGLQAMTLPSHCHRIAENILSSPAAVLLAAER